GARPVRMTAAAHDGAVALVSHVPQLLASTLLSQAAAQDGVMDLAAGSFRDLTRVASSSPEMWTQLLLA
ncbi:MAG: prephenate dehydrogenase/arogenate dehydrogenase family protein, partial [Actinobacteria bacterium]|nr:prephenate dehydrogenase/arogenate dehydrogenase family protein [Actinomycetota bacterium]NIT97004.1 prephenate dehydrogenase/arogenate dehydrogenase family protein [Actinomycetota bacterium]NIU20668.1 prephenate dehydrogenase/arogenate dehydrogenase family protein [Actinomycetota bacterium]NIV57182.1 prephenate dehydrogenase/arogenate dehydrogenase family protein [Actinomycetota bacterium]NIX51985.1 prephenate dehydrogenase/arogenate dehydrogenase family protein [Actinomycetota bacterium]